MNKLIIGLLFFFCIGTLQAQERYLNEITDSVIVNTYTYIQKDGQDLELDIYTPFDKEIDRPVVLYVHGGGFYQGTRNSGGAVAFCKRIAKYGYVSVSISYRLLRKDTKTRFGCDCTVENKLEAINAAVEDLNDAVHFLTEKSNDFGINPNSIIICGGSAGAETVLTAAFNLPQIVETEPQVHYAGVIAMAGAVADTSNINVDSAIPALFFHGTCDNLVPYGTAPHHYCSEDKDGYLVLHGSKTIAEKLEKLGKPFWLYTVCGENHRVAGSPLSNNFNQIITFCNDFVLNHSKEQVHTVVPGTHNCRYPEYGECNN